MMNEYLCSRVERELPEFVKLCQGDAGRILMHQAAFPVQDAELLGLAIKYASIYSKEITIICNAQLRKAAADGPSAAYVRSEGKESECRS